MTIDLRVLITNPRVELDGWAQSKTLCHIQSMMEGWTIFLTVEQCSDSCRCTPIIWDGFFDRCQKMLLESLDSETSSFEAWAAGVDQLLSQVRPDT